MNTAANTARPSLSRTIALVAGDRIMERNRPVLVTKVAWSANIGKRKMIAVTLETGRTFRCAHDARWVKVAK